MFDTSYLTKEQKLIKTGFKILIIIAVTGLSVIGYYKIIKIPAVVASTQKAVKNEIQKVNGEEISICVLKEKVAQGNIIGEDQIDTIKIAKNKVPDEVVISKDVLKNKVARIDLPARLPMIANMVVEDSKYVTKDLRTQDFKQFKLTTGLTKGKFIDVRIKKPSGIDEIFLAKKEVLEVNGQDIIFNRNELEVNYINSALVEALLTGAELYTVVYVDSQNQPPSQLTYTPNPGILKVIEANPDIVKNASEALEKKNSNGVKSSAPIEKPKEEVKQ